MPFSQIIPPSPSPSESKSPLYTSVSFLLHRLTSINTSPPLRHQPPLQVPASGSCDPACLALSSSSLCTHGFSCLGCPPLAGTMPVLSQAKERMLHLLLAFHPLKDISLVDVFFFKCSKCLQRAKGLHGHSCT